MQPYNALAEFRNYQMQDRQMAAQDEDRGLKNQLTRFQLSQAMETAGRERERRNLLAQAMQSGNPMAMMMADPKMAMQMQGMASRERMMQERLGMQERMGQAKMNQPIWDAERGVFVQRPGMGQAGSGGVITPQGLPPRRNPEMEKMQAKAAFQLPDVLQQGDMAIKQIDEMIGSEKGDVKEHPGFQNAVGMPNIFNAAARIMPGMFPGSDTASFNERLKQVKGGAFMEAFQNLRGGGQITEKEGEKATAAITRMELAQSEREFKAAAREFQGILKRGMDNARQQAQTGGNRPAQAPAAGQFKVLGVEGR